MYALSIELYVIVNICILYQLNYKLVNICTLYQLNYELVNIFII